MARTLAQGMGADPSRAVTEATITCPLCGTEAREEMPQNACRYFYICTGCGLLQ